MSFPNFLYCPDMKGQLTGKQQLIHYLLYVAFIAAILFLAIYMATRVDGSPMVRSYDSKELQFEKAKKLKPLAYTAARKKIKNNLKFSSGMEFMNYKSSSVLWEKENKFTCTVKAYTRDRFHSLTCSTFILRIEYLGSKEWILHDMKKIR